MASTAGVSAAADDPEYWPVGVDGARVVKVAVYDPKHPSFHAQFEFGFLPMTSPDLLGFSFSSERALYRGSLVDLPLRRWEKAALAAAEQRMLTTGPHGQHIDPDSVARDLVLDRHPELATATGGNALRRLNGLLHLAKMYGEYKRAEWAGSENPAQTLADAHGVTPATVRGWLHRARKEGLAPASDHPNAATRT
jgi:hypothetical protein